MFSQHFSKQNRQHFVIFLMICSETRPTFVGVSQFLFFRREVLNITICFRRDVLEEERLNFTNYPENAAKCRTSEETHDIL